MYRIRRRFTWAVGAVMFLVIALFTAFEYRYLRRHIFEEAYQRTELVLAEVEAMQRYVREVLRPTVRGLLPPHAFLPQAMSTTYVAREVTERFLERYPDYYFKFAALEPRNPANAADGFEREMIERFTRDPANRGWRGTVEREGGVFLVSASPIRMEEPCLQCHGDPRTAPAQLLETYGASRGFGRTVGDIAGIRSVAIPVGIPLANARRLALTHLLVALAGVALVTAGAGFAFRRLVTRPLGALEKYATGFGRGEEDVALPPIEDNEIGLLGRTLEQTRGQLREKSDALERRNADLLHAHELLAHKSDELEGFIQALAHDLKTPLANVRGYSELLEKGSLPPEESGRALRRVRHNAGVMARLIDDLLELSRIGIRVEPREETDAAATLGEALRIHEERIAERGAEIVVAPDLPCLLYPRTRLLQIFSNLVGNALAHTEGQERLRIEVGCRSGQGEHLFVVRDNGPGIEPSELAAVFAPFHTGRRRSSWSTGLGLTIVQRIVEKNGGRIWVESAPGKGAAFFFTIPDASAPGSAGGGAPP